MGGGKIPFRDSKLTRLLEAVLCPASSAASGFGMKGGLGTGSSDLNVSVMIVNVSPCGAIEKPTVNALRYGQVFNKAAASMGAGEQNREPLRGRVQQENVG